jgi:hypothetical protein
MKESKREKKEGKEQKRKKGRKKRRRKSQLVNLLGNSNVRPSATIRTDQGRKGLAWNLRRAIIAGTTV